ncbi:MAG TPA: TonB-dependent receptor, partial [Campylobacterales bacterium]|nr:TonB-dependent receptor [Campylobacterales bacterium]
TIGYKAKKLGSLSDEFEVSAYNNEVKHDMRTDFRNTGTSILSYYVESKTDGLKAENTANLSGHLIKIGADYYKRVWDAKNYSNYTTQTLAPATMAGNTGVPYPLAEVTTKNYGLYGKLAKTYGNLSVDAGIRYDISKMELDEDKVRASGISVANRAEILANPDDSWNNFSGSLMAKYGIGSGYVYAGYGHTVRLPDGAEKYHLMVHNRRGNAGLKPTINNEVDAGYAYAKEGVAFKVNTFYSKLQDYIYMYRYNASAFTYDNVNATMYGWDVSGAYTHDSGLSLELGVAQTFGKKESKTAYQSVALNDKELRNIPPLKARVAAKYEMGRFSSQAEWIAAAGQKATDSDGTLAEESTAGWAVVNLKAGYEFAKGWSAWVGVDNLFNKNYYIHGSNSNMLFISNQPNIHLNEPGRFVYANLGYKF